MEHENLNNQEPAQLGIGAVSVSLPTDEHLKFAEWCISNGVTTYYNEDDVERFIDNDKEIFFDISQIYEKFKRQ